MSSYEVFNMIYNVYDFCNNKPIKDFEQESFYYNRRTAERLRTRVVKIDCLIECEHFTKKHFLFYLLTICLQGGKKAIFTIDPDKIKATVKRFSIKQTEADFKFIKQLMEDTNTTLEDFLKVKENGQCLLFELFQKNYITVCLLIKFSKNILTLADSNSILSTDYKTFIKLLKTTVTFIKGE